jgi:type II secretory pathway component PulM
MKTLKQSVKKSITHPVIVKVIEQISARAKPVVDYYQHLNEREKQIVFFGGIIAILMIFYLIISGAYSFQSRLEKEYMVIQTFRADVEYLSKLYKDINNLTPNEFSPVTADTIKGDLTAISPDTPPNVEQIGDTIAITISQAKFSDVMNALNQLRKSYGIFPEKVKMVRLSESGYISCRILFKVTIQNGQ